MNLHGQLVGVNTAIFSGSGGNIGIGFAIPSNMVKAVMAQLVQYGEVKRGMLGVQLANHSRPDIAESLGLDNARGALVSAGRRRLARGQGRHQGRRRHHVDQRHATSRTPRELRNSIGLLRIGDKVEIGLLREGKPRRVTAVIGERNGADADSGSADSSGVRRRGARATPTNSGGVLVQSGRRRQPGRAERPARERRHPRRSAAMRITNVEQLRAAVKDANAFAITIQRGSSRWCSRWADRSRTPPARARPCPCARAASTSS